METTYITLPLTKFLNRFAGRKNTPGYDETRMYQIAECNRDFVWSLEYQRGLIESVLKSAPIPTIAICNNEIVDGGNRSTTLHQFVHDQFKVTFDGVEYDYDAVRGNAELNNKWLSCQVNLMVTTGATDDQFADLYENLNKGVKLTHGQMMMNRTHTPLVRAVLTMLGRTTDVVFPLADVLHRVWKETFNTTKTRQEVTLGLQILASALFGPEHYHMYFNRHATLLRDTTQDNIDNKMINLSRILSMIDSVDSTNTIVRKTKSDVFRRFIGAIINDYHNMESVAFHNKWIRFLRIAYTELSVSHLKKLVFVGSKRSHATLRVVGISDNVREYLAGSFNMNDAATVVSTDPEDDSE